MFGINNRTTKDMDTTITGIDISKDKMIKVLNEVLSINLCDGIKFDVVSITDIREEDQYGGSKYHVVGKMDNLKINVEIDISTGDKVTPRELNFKYPLMFEDRYIYINTYNIETILSEKLETVLRRGKFNSRMKDYYDIYYFLSYCKENIDMEVLKCAINNTFKKRESFAYLNDCQEILNSIYSSERMNKQWIAYSNKYNYAKDIKFEQILDLLKILLENLELEVIAI